MSTRDIEDVIKDIYGISVDSSLVSRITDKILPKITEWNNRPLEKIYAMIFALTNTRTKNQVWNWVRWVKSSSLVTKDRNQMWIFSKSKEVSILQWNYRMITSLNNGDILWVTYHGYQWGSLWTSTRDLGAVPKSFGLFVVNEDFTF